MQMSKLKHMVDSATSFNISFIDAHISVVACALNSALFIAQPQTLYSLHLQRLLLIALSTIIF